MISLILVIILPCMVRANSYNSNTKGNMLYVQLLNYAMPVIKATAFNEDDMAESNFTITRFMLSMVGLDLNNPLSVLNREIAFIGPNNGDNGSSVNVSFNHFKLDDKQISKIDGNINSNNTQDLSLENKVVNVYDPKLKKTINANKPEVLIYHTHTTESYKPGKPDSFDNTQNVVAVGDALINELQSNYGISSINDKTVHNAEAYNQSYARSVVTLDKYLSEYKDFRLIIDMHRDSVENKKAVTIKMNGENVATFALVMSRKNPHFEKNMALANKIMDVSNKLFPGFCKGVIYYNYGTRYFNQDRSNNAVLIEVGADINTSEEAKASAKYLARIIAEVLNK
ncbi:stage II sporulation protein P [Clostridium sp. DJ247]|nr:stage II sporulation protein P [Clostridium sp. DJ247]MBC2579258.1 stage II sporulation protein P [Clostridium sp. DJ247]MBC2579291.1 stage II sporulation protein P [Clostridium sp. DJ247]